MFKKALKVVVGVALGLAVTFGMVSPASAALDPSIATGLTGIQTDATSLNTLVVPVVFAILSMLIIIKLIKRFGNKL